MTLFKGEAITPHPYQRAAIASVLRGWRQGHKTQLIVLPTGTGKTIAFGFLIKHSVEKFGRRCLVLAHREELINQAVAKLAMIGQTSTVEKASRKALDMVALGKKVVVGCVATMKGKRLATWPRDTFDVIVCDEAHHATASTYKAIFDHFETAKVVGVTATDRSDGDNLGRVFAHKAYEMTLLKAIEDRWLVPVRGVRSDVRVDLRGIRTTAGDFNQEDLSTRISAAMEPLASGVKKEIGDRKTIAFFPDVRSAMAGSDALNEVGVTSVAIYGDSPTRARDIEAFERGDHQVLCNCGIATEGYDHPPVSAIALLRPTKSMTLLMQMVGRGTRLSDGKDDCLVIDFGWIIGDKKLKSVVDLVVPKEANEADVQAAKELMDSRQESDPIKALDEAKRLREAKEAADNARKRDRLAVRVKDRDIEYGRVTFDPVGVRLLSGLRAPESRGDTLRIPISEDAAKRLKDLGFDSTDGMSQREADTEIGYWEDRRQCGMSSLKQCKLLMRNGHSNEQVRMMSQAEAQAVIGPLLARFKAKSG